MANCDHHEHQVLSLPGDEECATWRATATGGSIIGDFCTDHLGDGLADYDGHVNLDRLDQR